MDVLFSPACYLAAATARAGDCTPTSHGPRHRVQIWPLPRRAAIVRAMKIGCSNLRRVLGACAALVLAASGGAAGAGALPMAVDGQPLPSLAPMLERATPAVVNIAARGVVEVGENPLFSDPFFQRFFNLPLPRRQREVRSVGSGVIVDAAAGLVITNHHVIDGTAQIAVTLRDGRTLDATLVGSDPATDLALLEVPAANLSELAFADSDALRVGDYVVAIGNPFGLGQTVTSGIVSALGRGGLGAGSYEDFIQTDAAINSGNSGGALVNLRGELVGINSQIISGGGGSIGIGFAIPTNMVRDIMAQLVAHGEVRRGLLGVATQDLTPDLATAFGLPADRGGAVVVEIQRGSPAEQAGLQTGDVVVEINNRAVRRSQDLRNALGVLAVGERARLVLVRDGKERTVETRIGEPGGARLAGTALADRLAGAVFADIDEHSPLSGRIEGVLVAEVEAGSRAWRHGLRQGDVVLAVNRERVRTTAQLKAAVGAGSSALMLNIQRGRAALFILIQ
jgi:serine protease Do/serine protease DegQ